MESQGRNVMVQGRIVWTSGDLFKGKPKTDQQTRQPIMNQKTGLQKIEYGFGLAVPKSVLNQTGPGQPGEIWAALHEEAVSIFPSRQIPPGFALKYKDGDGVDHTGASMSTREGHAGHIIFACTTSLPIKFFKNENGQNIQVNEGINAGDYVWVQLNIKAHPAIGQAKAGMYLNPNAVQLIQKGKEIINTPSGDQIFGTTAPQLGAHIQPVAPTTPNFMVPTGAPQAQQFQQPVQGGYQAPQQPMAPPAPHYGVVPQNHQPQQFQQPQVPNGYPAPGQNVPAANNGYPTMAQPGFTPETQTAQYPTPGTGYPPVAAPMGAFPGNFQQPQQQMPAPGGMPPVPGFPQR